MNMFNVSNRDMEMTSNDVLLFNTIKANVQPQRNLSIDLNSKSIDWFLYDENIGLK